MSQPYLFVVCKNCGSEVSPYVTECPYCGQRVRKRAPKLERGGEDAAPLVKRRRPRLSGLRPDEIEGIADLGHVGAAGHALREVLIHMIEEYARHMGHADLLRERLDGRRGQ